MVSLSPSWHWSAAKLSRPVDLTPLVSLSRSNPESFLSLKESKILQQLVQELLNNEDNNKSDKDTKIDVLTILANIAALGTRKARQEVRRALQSVSEWFDEYLISCEGKNNELEIEPELHKAMLLLLARAWDFKLKTEDVLELTGGNRSLAVEIIVGLLEDGETYSTEVKQRRKPGEGQVGQWEHELVIHRHEKPLILQMCRLLRGFTHPNTYFNLGINEGDGLKLHSVDEFSHEIDSLLEITMRSRLVEKLSVALYDCLFDDNEELIDGDNNDDSFELYTGTLLEESDHLAIHSVNQFLQNLYFYASHRNEEYRQHMLTDTLLIPRLILPYLDKCVMHAEILSQRSETYSKVLNMDYDTNNEDKKSNVSKEDIDEVSNIALEYPALVKGISTSLRTLIIASFRAPSTRFVMGLLRRLNPTTSLLRARAFCIQHDYIFALLCLLNVNMGALDLSNSNLTINNDDKKMTDEEQEAHDLSLIDAYHAHSLLNDIARIFSMMKPEKCRRIIHRVVCAGALPICRDTHSYSAIMSVLHGGEAGQTDYAMKSIERSKMNKLEKNYMNENDNNDDGKESDEMKQLRADMKRASLDKVASFKDDKKQSNKNKNENKKKQEAKESKNESISLSSLGGLPDIKRGKTRFSLDLELPEEQFNSQEKNNNNENKNEFDNINPDEIPKEFKCEINGHIMKEPVRTPSGHYFEKSTIELWLDTRGSICPISHETLLKQDLIDDNELRSRIMKWHIQKTSYVQTTEDDDDIYDF